MATIKATLKDIKKNNVIYPQTSADNVYSIDGTTVEKKLTNFANYLSSLSMAFDYRGYFPTESALLSKYPNGITYPDAREGWYARVGAEDKTDTTMYYWDVEGNTWVKGSSVEITGITTVNGIQPKEDGNVTITAEDIPTSFMDEQGKQKSTQDVFNMLQGEHLDLSSDIEGLSSNIDNLSNSITDLEDEIAAVNDKSTVLYLTNEEMEAAVSPSQLLSKYDDGQVVVCNDDGNYKLGSSYKYIAIETDGTPVNAWEEITSSGSSGEDIETSGINFVKEIFVPALEHSETYETLSNSSYTFTMNQDGWLVCDKIYNTYNAAMIKVNIHLNRETDLVIDYEKLLKNGASSASSGFYFSDINTPMEPSHSSTTGALYSSGPNDSGKITYKNFPAGDNFIYVKFRVYGDYMESAKFKIVGDFDKDAYSYTVEDYLTLDASASLINSAGEIANKSELLAAKKYGTAIEPINLFKLDSGFYLVSGYLKINKYLVPTYFDQKTRTFAEILMEKTINNRGEHAYAFYNATKHGSQTFSDTDIISPEAGRMIYFRQGTTDTGKYAIARRVNLDTALENYDTAYDTGSASALSIYNQKAYTPTHENNPATKGSSEQAVRDVFPSLQVIDISDDISSPEQKDYLRFSTNQDYSKLYFYKSLGEETIYTPVVASVNYDKMCLLKSFVDDSTFPDSTYICFYPTVGTNNSFAIRFYTGASKELKFGNYVVYNTSSGWSDKIIEQDGYILLKETYNNLAGSTGETIYMSPGGDFGEYGATYLKALSIGKILSPVEIPLSTSGGSAELPEGIISFKGLYSNDSAYSKNDLVYHNNHFFICVADSSTNVTPVENMFYTELAGTIYWRNIGYSSEWANKALSDGEGNNIINTYVAKTTTINDEPLSSNITLKASNIKTNYNDGQDSIEKVLNDLESGLIQTISYVDGAVESVNNSIGDQVTYSLTGTTLTITPKVTQ